MDDLLFFLKKMNNVFFRNTSVFMMTKHCALKGKKWLRC